MKTFDDLLEYELGEEVQLFNAPRQNPRIRTGKRHRERQSNSLKIARWRND